MKENEKELKFNQLITKIIIGRFKTNENRHRIIFLSKGILIAEKDVIYFYEYERYSKKFIMLLNEKEKKNFCFSKLLNDKFCIYSPGETKIYQFNNKDFTSQTEKERIHFQKVLNGMVRDGLVRATLTAEGKLDKIYAQGFVQKVEMVQAKTPEKTQTQAPKLERV